MNDQITPPIAKTIPVETIHHGDKRVDNYTWMHDLKDPEMLDYLTKENEYTEHISSQFRSLQDKIYNEIISRIVEDDVRFRSSAGSIFIL
jgi:oligopeptidase B